MNINSLAKLVHQHAVDAGFWEEEKTVPEQLVLFHSEISEALEEWRDGHGITEVYYNGSKPEGFGIELADCVIRILDTCWYYGIDLEKMILLKHEYNKTREYKHGGKRI